MAQQKILRLHKNGPSGQGLMPLELDAADFQSSLPEQFWHVYHSDADAGLFVGVWTTTDMQEAFGPYPGDEFMVILEGVVALVDSAGMEARVHSGEAFAVRSGTQVSWLQRGFCRKFFVIYDPPGKVRPAGISIADGIAIWGGSEEPVFRNETAVMTAGGGFLAHLNGPTHAKTCHRFVYVRSGQGELMNSDGLTEIFAPGDAFFIPAGVPVGWSSRDKVQVYWCDIDEQAK